MSIDIITSNSRVTLEKVYLWRVFLMAALGLRAFKLEHGAYPNELAELVPEYLKFVPDDPFSEGALLRYKIDGEKYTLYSIGPDGVDDGGAPILNPNKGWPRSERQVFLDSKGDIVAGINT